MQVEAIVARLSTAPAMLQGLVAGVSEEDARWRPADGGWSILEIVNHMADEETDDFRPRLESTLRNPEQEWPPLDLDNVAERRAYNEQALRESLDRLARTRVENVQWLRALAAGGSADWTKTHTHPKLGPISAADLLASWAAHDALHLRQIAKRLFQLAERDGEGASTAYAGEWKA